MQRTFAIVAVGLAVLAVLAPEHAPRLLDAVLSAGSQPAAESRFDGDAELQRTASESRRERSSPRRRAVVEADARGHFMVDGASGTRRLTLMVDTGATNVALTADTARRIGMRPARRDYRYPVSTANGVVYAARVKLPSLTVAGIRVNDVEAMVIPKGALDVNLLGMSYLSKLSGFRISGDRLVLDP